MATITLTIPDAALPRIREGMCRYIGITEPAQMTNAVAKNAVVQAVKNIVKAQEALVAQEAAAATALPDPEVS